MEIAVLQYVTKEIKDYTKYSIPKVTAYCIEHGYSSIVINGDYYSHRHPSWGKVKSVIDLDRFLYDFDFIMIIDADVDINNFNNKIEDIIKEWSKDETYKDQILAVCDDKPNGGLINCGVMIVKINTNTKSFMLNWYNAATENEKDNHLWEQSTLRRLMDDSEIRKLVKIFPIDRFNSHFLNMDKDQFIHHYMARSIDDKIEIFKNIWNEWFFKYGN